MRSAARESPPHRTGQSNECNHRHEKAERPERILLVFWRINILALVCHTTFNFNFDSTRNIRRVIKVHLEITINLFSLLTGNLLNDELNH